MKESDFHARRRIAFGAAALAAAAIWFVRTAEGLTGGFTGDDLMNMYFAVQAPPGELLGDLLLFFRPSRVYRPAGAILYRLLYESFGLDPLPLRLACHALILVNAALAYLLVKRLAGSLMAGAAAAALHTFHREFHWYYVNGGLCYDLLCFFSYATAFLYYLRIRERGRAPGARQCAVWAGLYILCLNSKEMAVSLPVMIGLYELFYGPGADGRARIPLLGAAMTLAFIAGRILGPGTLTAMEAYRPDLRLEVFLDHGRHYLWLAFGRPGWMGAGTAAAALLLMAAAAFRVRLPALRFGLAWMLVGILPLVFIPKRGLEQALIPALGLALFVAAALSAMAGRAGVALWSAAALALVLALAGRIPFHGMTEEARRIRAADAQLRKLLPEIPDQAHILLLANPLAPNDWAFVQLAALRHRRRRPQFHRLDLVLKHWPASEPARFDIVINYEDGRLMLCDPQPFRGIPAGGLGRLKCAPQM